MERQQLGRGLEVSRRTTADSEDLDLLADFNVERIQQFLNKPFERVGEALEKVEERLKARNITLVDDLKRENDRSPRQRREEVKRDPTLSSTRKMGPRARFGDGDGGFWDRWLTDAGCSSGSGEYAMPTNDVAEGFVAPKSGFKAPLGEAMPSPPPRRVSSPPKPEQVAVDVEGRFYKAYGVAEDELKLSERRMLRALDASSSTKVSVAAQHLMDDEAVALGRALTRATDVELTSLNVSRNALGKGLNAVLRGAASFSKLETLDASGVSPFDMDALASALTSGFEGLRVLRLARCQAVHKSNCRGASHWLIAHRCQLRDGSIVELCRALRSKDSPPLEVLDVSNNALGDGDPSGEDDAAWFRAPFCGPLGALVGDASTLDDADKEKDLVEGERRDGPLSLTSLDASGNRLRPENVRGIALGLSVSRLRHLSISDNPDVGNCIELGAAIQTAALLEELSLARTGLRATGAVVVAVGARRSRYVHRLDVSGNAVGAAGVILAALSLDEERDCSVVMRDCDFVAASSEVVVDWLHQITVSRKSRPPLRYEFNVEDPLDAALASETLRLCARDDFAVASAVARVAAPQRRPVEAPRTDARARRPAIIAPKAFDAFRLRRPRDNPNDVLDARTLKKVRAELEPKLARRGKAVARETLDVAKVEKLLKSVDGNATSKDAERALLFLDFDERGTVDAFAAYRYALEATPQLLRRRAAGAAPARPLLKEEDVFDAPATGVLQLRCFMERTVRGSQSANVLKLAQDLDDCVTATDLAAKARVTLDVDDALALALSLAERDDCTDVLAVALVAPLTTDPRDARCVRDALLGRLFSYKADAEERLSIVERYRALRAKLGPGHRAFLGPRDGRYALDLSRPGDRAALRELFAVDAFRNCRVDGSSQPLGVASTGEPPKRDAQLAALFASEGAPSLGSRTDGLVVLDVASRAPPQPETTPALDSTVFVDACEAFGWCRSDEQRRAWATLVEGPRPADKPTKRLFGGARCAAAAFVELFRLRSLVKAGLPDVRRKSQPEQLTVAGSCESLGRARRRSSDASQRRAAPDVALEDALDLIGAAPSVTVNQARALLRWCPLADDGLPAQVPNDDDEAWSTEDDACSGRRARLTCALLAKLRAPIDVAALFDILTPPERARVVNQAGWANVWSPLRPDGSYVLNLALPEDRQIARSLTHMEATEAYSQLLDLRLLDVPSIDNWAAPAAEKVVEVNPWRRELPAKGVWGITFKSKSDDPRDSDLALRAALAVLTTTAPPEAFALVPDAPFGKLSPANVARKSRSQLKGACRLEDAVYDWERPIV